MLPRKVRGGSSSARMTNDLFHKHPVTLPVEMVSLAQLLSPSGQKRLQLARRSANHNPSSTEQAPPLAFMNSDDWVEWEERWRRWLFSKPPSQHEPERAYHVQALQGGDAIENYDPIPIPMAESNKPSSSSSSPTTTKKKKLFRAVIVTDDVRAGVHSFLRLSRRLHFLQSKVDEVWFVPNIVFTDPDPRHMKDALDAFIQILECCDRWGIQSRPKLIDHRTSLVPLFSCECPKGFGDTTSASTLLHLFADLNRELQTQSACPPLEEQLGSGGKSTSKDDWPSETLPQLSTNHIVSFGKHSEKSLVWGSLPLHVRKQADTTISSHCPPSTSSHEPMKTRTLWSSADVAVHCVDNSYPDPSM